MLGRKEVDRKLGGEPSGQSTEWKGGNKGENQGERGIKRRKKGVKEGAWGKGEGRGLITLVKDEGWGWGKGPCTRIRVFSSTSMDKGA